MDLRPHRAPRGRGARYDGLAAAAAGGGWADVASVTLGTGFATTLAGLAAIHVVAAVADVFIIPQAPLLPVAALGTGAVLALLWVHHLRRPRTGSALQTLLGLAFALVTADLVVHLVVGADPMQTVYLTLVLVAAGALVPQARWLVVCDVLAAVAVVAVALPRLDGRHAQHAVTATIFAVVVAHLLQRHAGRGRRQLQVLTTALARGALADPLTGLANRQGLAEGLEQVLAGAGPAGERGVAALCFDVDGFKAINDDLGHATGDAVLVEIAERLREMVREGDVVARLGGDEFALVLADAGPTEAGQVAERARLRLRGSAGVLDMPWSVSVGLACASVGTLDAAEDLLRRADLAMYEDKRARRAATARRGAGAATTAGPPPTGSRLAQVHDVARTDRDHA